MSTYIIRDVRLHGWKPQGDVLEVNFDTPISWIINRIRANASKKLVVKLMAHGLPGFIQCGKGSKPHPQVGNGMSIDDLKSFRKIRGKIKRLEFHSCLVARIGSCHESGKLDAYDGNLFCYRIAQTIKAQVKASIHLQWYTPGTTVDGRPTGRGIDFGKWNGRVFTWGRKGKIIKMQDYPYRDS